MCGFGECVALVNVRQNEAVLNEKCVCSEKCDGSFDMV